MKRYLIITIDTEEEFNWQRAFFPSEGGTVKNVNELRHLQKVFSELSAKVTYFADFPVLEDETARNILREFHGQYGAEIGTHLHPWCTPPFGEELNRVNTMANNLPADLVRSKLEALTELFIQVFGFRPCSYRAGRFAFDRTSAEIIGELGYHIDSSITPFYDWSRGSGPNFFFAPLRPYFIDDQGICSEKKNGKILEVPISTGFNRTPFRFWSKIYFFARKRHLRFLRMAGALDRSHLLKRIILGPELQSLEEMKSLVKGLCREEFQVFNMIFHSSSLLAGGDPTIRSPQEVGAFKKRVIDTVSWMIQECGAEPIRLSDYLPIHKATEPVREVEAQYHPCRSN